MRVSIYARYSSDLQRAASIEDQILVCTERAVREKWLLVATYADRGMSGASNLRPGYQKILDAARNGEFDIVLVEALDRISRDQEHIASFFKLMSFAGVRIVTLAEGEITELHVGLKGTMNALFLKDLAEKTRRGLRGRVEQGRSGGGLCYGYAVLRSMNGERGGREIVEAEAEVVRRIFADFAAGKSPRRIATELNQGERLGPAADLGATRRSADMPSAAQASSTTNSTSAESSGIDCVIARIQRRDGAFRASIRSRSGFVAMRLACESWTMISGTAPRRGSSPSGPAARSSRRAQPSSGPTAALAIC